VDGGHPVVRSVQHRRTLLQAGSDDDDEAFSEEDAAESSFDGTSTFHAVHSDAAKNDPVDEGSIGARIKPPSPPKLSRREERRLRDRFESAGKTLVIPDDDSENDWCTCPAVNVLLFKIETEKTKCRKWDRHQKKLLNHAWWRKKQNAQANFTVKKKQKREEKVTATKSQTAVEANKAVRLTAAPTPSPVAKPSTESAPEDPESVMSALDAINDAMHVQESDAVTDAPSLLEESETLHETLILDGVENTLDVISRLEKSNAAMRRALVALSQAQAAPRDLVATAQLYE
jgi:hypothetical protein